MALDIRVQLFQFHVEAMLFPLEPMMARSCMVKNVGALLAEDVTETTFCLVICCCSFV